MSVSISDISDEENEQPLQPGKEMYFAYMSFQHDLKQANPHMDLDKLTKCGASIWENFTRDAVLNVSVIRRKIGTQTQAPDNYSSDGESKPKRKRTK